MRFRRGSSMGIGALALLPRCASAAGPAPRASAGATARAEPGTARDSIMGLRERAMGFRALFDGRTLAGWTPRPAGGRWSASGGVLRFSGAGQGWLRTDSTYDDFDLRLDWRNLSPRGVVGLYVRAAGHGDPWPGPADLIEIRDVPVPGVPARATGWDSLEIVADGPMLTVRRNGRAEFSSRSALKIGYIGLRGNGRPFAVRNVRVRETGWATLFDGRGLAAWRPSSSHWAVRPGGILASDGHGGVLSTVLSFTDYDLRLEWRTPSSGARSGVELRGPGSPAWLVPLGSSGPAARPGSAWNHLDVRVRGSRVEVWENGDSIAPSAPAAGAPPRGPIGLVGDRGPVWFRAIAVRRAGAGDLPENPAPLDEMRRKLQGGRGGPDG